MSFIDTAAGDCQLLLKASLGIGVHERCRRSCRNSGPRRDRHLLRQSGHVRDAPRRGAGQGKLGALHPGPVRRCRHDRRQPGADAAARRARRADEPGAGLRGDPRCDAEAGLPQGGAPDRCRRQTSGRGVRACHDADRVRQGAADQISLRRMSSAAFNRTSRWRGRPSAAAICAVRLVMLIDPASAPDRSKTGTPTAASP